MDIKKILVPTDFSANARAAIAPARVLAERFGARVDVIYVYETLPLGIPEWNALGPDGNPIAARLFLKNLAEQEMEKLLGELRRSGMTVHGRLEEGSAWRAIARVAEHDRYDLVVLATHGYRGVERLVMGSTAEKVVRHCSVPVLTIHPAALDGA
jgi:nucleotide-binding universal stress UspA family protein